MASEPSYAATLISISLSSPRPILRFGEFVLKSGRKSPYFFNFGLFDTGALLLSLTEAFADAIITAFPEVGLANAATASTPEVLFGPAYKGIPLVACIATALARRGRDIGFAYNRKEAKDHGEGGTIVGAPLDGKKVLIIDDVITSGLAIRIAYELVKGQGGKVVGIVEALDREERGNGSESAVQAIERELAVPVVSVIKMRDIISWLGDQGRDAEMKAMEKYREEYGV